MTEEEAPAPDHGAPARPASRRRPATPARGRVSGRWAKASRASSTRSASYWVLAIAILQLLFGAFFGARHAKEADAALVELSAHADDATFDIDGTTTTAAELRKAVERERLQAYVVPIGLGVVFLALFAWARKSPLPALGSALALFVTVHAVSAVFDPKQLLSGIVFKVLCIGALASGIKSALQQRAIDQRDAAADA